MNIEEAAKAALLEEAVPGLFYVSRAGLERFAKIIRNQALEDAAKEAEHWQTISTTPGHACGQYIGGAIRAMKEQT